MMDATDVLMGWSEASTRREESMLALMAAAIMHKLGETHLEISKGEIEDMIGKVYIEQTVSPDGQSVTIRLRKVGDDEPELPLEVVSKADDPSFS